MIELELSQRKAGPMRVYTARSYSFQQSDARQIS
jgi:hypothetical protein